MEYYKKVQELRKILYAHGSLLVEMMAKANLDNSYFIRVSQKENDDKVHDIWHNFIQFFHRVPHPVYLEIVKKLTKGEQAALKYMWDTIG